MTDHGSSVPSAEAQEGGRPYLAREPDYIYNPNDWEITYAWSDRSLVTEDAHLDVGEVRTFGTLIVGPLKFVARVPLSWDEDGCPDETEVRWFDSKQAALDAALRSPATDASVQDAGAVTDETKGGTP